MVVEENMEEAGGDEEEKIQVVATPPVIQVLNPLLQLAYRTPTAITIEKSSFQHYMYSLHESPNQSLKHFHLTN